MSTDPFDRVLWNQGERPLSTDWNQALSNDQATWMNIADYLLRASQSIASGASVPLNSAAFSAFLADSFQVFASTPIANLNVTINPGLGFAYLPSDEPTNIGGISGCDDVYPLKPVPLSSAQVLAVPTPDATNPRYDIIEVAYTLAQGSPQSRDVLAPSTGTVTATSVNKVMSYDLAGNVGVVTSPANSTAGIGYKKGVPASSPTVPANTIGYITIAVIYVPANATGIPQQNIVDARPLTFPGSVARVTGTLTLTTDGTNVTALTGEIQAPPGVRAAAFVHANLNSNGVTVIVVAGGGEGSTCQWRALYQQVLSLASAVGTVTFGMVAFQSATNAGFMLPFGWALASTSWVAPYAGTFRNLTAYCENAPAGGSQTLTAWKNGVAQTPTVTLAIGANAAQDDTNSFSFVQGDLIQIGYLANTGATGVSNANLEVTAIFEVTNLSAPAGVRFGDVAIADLGTTDAGDMQNIGVSPVGIPGAVQVYGAASNGQPAFKFNIPISVAGVPGNYSYQFDALISSGAES